MNTTITKAVEQLRAKSVTSSPYRAYYRGQHASPFLGIEGKSPYRKLVSKLRENYCRNVIDLTVDRMELTGIETSDPDDLIGVGAAAIAWDAWMASRMDLKMRKWLTSMEVTGQPSALIVWPDTTGAVRFYSQEPEQVAYSLSEETGALLWLVKAWLGDDDYPHLTLFYPDIVQVWKSNAKQLTLSDINGNIHSWNAMYSPDAGTYTLVSETENPLGQVPAVVVERDFTDLTSVIPLQDQLNQTLANQAITEFSFAMPVRVLMGFELPDPDENGVMDLPYKIETDRILVAPGAEDGAQAQQVYDLPGANPTPYIAIADSLRASIVRVSRVPSHLLLQSGQFPSGESLRTAEAPFVAKVKQRMHEYGAAIADAAEYAARLEALTRTGTDLEGLRFSATWGSPLAQADATNATIATDWAAIGIPLEVIGREVLGWDAAKAKSVAGDALALAEDRAGREASRFDAGQIDL